MPRYVVFTLILFACVSALAFKNPLLRGQDPSVVFHDNAYYLVQSEGRLIIRQADTIKGLAEAPKQEVWPRQCCNIWAPELQKVQGRWMIYYARDDGKNENHRMYALESTTDSPLGPYRERGKVYDSASDRWAIDGAAIETPEGNLYFVWSGWPGATNGQQYLYIAPMSNPWTISGPRALLSKPTESWEKHGMPIHEGPQPFWKEGRLFLAFSASGSWTDDYCLGLLTHKGGDLLDAANWTKTGPVFSKVENAYGPGHGVIMQGAQGRWWNFYHANVVSGTGWRGRTIRAQPLAWIDDIPDFGKPAPIDLHIPEPTTSTPQEQRRTPAEPAPVE